MTQSGALRLLGGRLIHRLAQSREEFEGVVATI